MWGLNRCGRMRRPTSLLATHVRNNELFDWPFVQFSLIFTMFLIPVAVVGYSVWEKKQKETRSRATLRDQPDSPVSVEPEWFKDLFLPHSLTALSSRSHHAVVSTRAREEETEELGVSDFFRRQHSRNLEDNDYWMKSYEMIGIQGTSKFIEGPLKPPMQGILALHTCRRFAIPKDTQPVGHVRDERRTKGTMLFGFMF